MKKLIVTIVLSMSSGFLLGMTAEQAALKMYTLMSDSAKSDEDILIEMKKNSFTVASKDPYGNTLLDLALISEREDLTKKMIEDKNFDISIKLRSDENLLLTVVKKGWAGSVGALIQKGADVNAQNTWGQSALILAADEGFPEIIKQLLAVKGIKLNEQEKNSGWTPLHWAVHNAYSWSSEGLRRRECAKLLIAAGADPDIKGFLDPRTPIELVIENKYDDDGKFVPALEEIEKFKASKGNVLGQKLKSLQDKLVELKSKLSSLSAKLITLKNNLKK